MAAGLGFKTFTTGEVLTAADVNGYLMQGILVFANAAARTSAITAPQEGQYSFLKDTNALEYYDGAAWVGAPVGDITAVTAGTGISGGGSSGAVTITNDMATTITASGDIVVGTGSGTYDNLPIGSTGQVLTADTTVSPYKVKWAAAAGGGGMTLLSTTTLSGGSTNITSIASGYNDLVVIIKSFKPASDAGLFMRINNTGGGGNTYYSSTNTAETGATHNASTINIAPDQDSAGDYSLIRVLIPDYTNTTTWKWVEFTGVTQNQTTNTNINWRVGVGVWNAISAINELNFFPGAGNFTSGTVLVYGVK
jgi:hypothetical protein